MVGDALAEEGLQALLNAFITGGLCSRMAWLSGRGVPNRRARSMIATSSGSKTVAGFT
ncbi:MAG: hypothetical protein ACRDOI_14040 [Trebonia sp.]